MSACVCFLDVIKGEKMNPVFDEPPNPTNVEDTLQRIKSNDSSLTEVNLNNIKVRRNTSVYRVWLKAGVYLRTNGSVSVGFSEHSNSHAEGHRQSHGEQHTRQEVQHGGDTEQRPSRCGEMECLVCFLMTFAYNLHHYVLKILALFPRSSSQAFSDMLRANKTLRSLNLESNFITGTGVQAVVDALRDNDTLTEIKIDNQVTDDSKVLT